MMREDVRIKLQNIFEDVFDNVSIVLNDETSAVDIDGWDSLTHITILSAVQDEFSISFNINEIVEMKNVGDIIDCIIKKMK